MAKNDNWIVITSINPPSEAIVKYSNLSNWTTIVIGDVTTPKIWEKTTLDLIYLSFEDQQKLRYKLAKIIPEKSYMRKMLGYLYAIEHGAKVIVDTDDDNIPTDEWDSQWKTSSLDMIDYTNGEWINTYKLYGAKKAWPRGLPLDTLMNPSKFTISKKRIGNRMLGVIQGLANGDPDVDAIYRLTNNKSVYFKKRANLLVLSEGSLTPINSQNTHFDKKFFQLLYLPVTVTFRSTDIIRGYVAQPILWGENALLGIANAGVIQVRNPHNYLDDFKSEVPIFLDARKIGELANISVKKEVGISKNMIACYDAYINAKIVDSSEMKYLNAWLEDLQDIMR
jgi:hypothetical protein